jgi:hypothetical protein
MSENATAPRDAETAPAPVGLAGAGMFAAMGS